MEDPKGVLRGLEHADVVAREGFCSDEPKIAQTLFRMRVPINEVQVSMYEAEQTSYPEAAKNYIESHSKGASYWLTGELD
ncbi:hypothetical protein DRB17_18115 [Ferruginivarius sediminum]|uniref:ABC-type glycine betaine transport system substrate-binding domain-containing protein n=1 Tax=Ferruginivarius sediminum TaxID=2661937 RepID=A0A369T514_9PROT|nr:hypothetical protein DRB17_18115 [Ferruginivarius sediminum]